MISLGAAGFPAFFEAVWGYPPFAWQTRLLACVRTEGWPSTLDLPTGSGKTAALDVALFALALDAFEEPPARRQPRRIALVVDRRTVVDQAYARAVRLAQALRDARDGVVAQVAGALRALQGDEAAPPVLPAILRGGMPRESEWARTPHQPVLLVSTVDQVGSRLLFRGYGVSDRMKPVHAGLLGRDTLYLLDEAHLSRPFEETLAALVRYGRSGRIARELPRPLVFVRMSATVAERPADAFSLRKAEREEPVLARRIAARKRARLREVKAPKDPEQARANLAKVCVAEVKRLADGPARVIAVIVNRVDTARRAAALGREALSEAWDVQLLTGRMRPLDRADLEVALLERIRAGRARGDDRVLLVSTQAVEAGADLDFDALVTECASLDSLRQRFGRLDRLGELGESQAVVVASSGEVAEGAPPDPVYGEALQRTWRWLAAQVAEGGPEPGDGHVTDARQVEVGIEALDARLAAMGEAELRPLLAPRPVAPILTPSHLDRWAQTSPIPSADPDVASFLHGPGRGTPDVQVVWRADLEADLLRDESLADVRAMLAAVPPSALEGLPVPLWTARRWLEAVASARAEREGEPVLVPAVADVEGLAEAEEPASSHIAPAVVWRGDDTALATTPETIRPGDTLVVPSSYGGLDPRWCCWDPKATDPVRDRGDEARLLHRGRVAIRWSPAVLRGWCPPGRLADGPALDAGDLDERGADAERDAFEAWRAEVLVASGTPNWARVALEVLASRRPELVRVGDGVGAWRASAGARRLPRRVLQRLSGIPGFDAGAGSAAGLGAGDATTEDDGGSFTSAAVSLERHLVGVEGFAQHFASALALPADVSSDVALAGRLHDLGKADPRFQLWLHGGDPVAHALAPEALAKSAAPAVDRAARERSRERAGYPSGTRHELTSVALVQHSEELRARARDWDLVLHLVASHHGWCRPFAPPAIDPAAVGVKVTLDGVPLSTTSDHGLVRIDSGVAERFWGLVRSYGWWGLAWLEAVLRLADHRESEQEARDA